MNPTQQQLPDLKTTAGVKCSNCNNQIFAEGIILRKASKFLTGTTQDSLIPLPIFYCVKCSHPINGMIPLVIRNEYDENGEPAENIKRLNHEH